MEIKAVFCKRCGHAVGRSITQCPMCGKKTRDPILRLGERVDQLGETPRPEKTEPRKPKQTGKPRPAQSPKPRPEAQKIEARSIPRQPKKKGCGCCSGCFTIIIAIVIALGFLIFNPGAIDLPPEIRDVIDEIRYELFDLHDSQIEQNKEAPADIPAKPPSAGGALVVNQIYKTKRGFMASLKKEDLLLAIQYVYDGSHDELEALRVDKAVVHSKAGLRVLLLEVDPQMQWVHVKIVDQNTKFYTQPEALVK